MMRARQNSLKNRVYGTKILLSSGVMIIALSRREFNEKVFCVNSNLFLTKGTRKGNYI